MRLVVLSIYIRLHTVFMFCPTLLYFVACLALFWFCCGLLNALRIYCDCPVLEALLADFWGPVKIILYHQGRHIRL